MSAPGKPPSKSASKAIKSPIKGTSSLAPSPTDRVESSPTYWLPAPSLADLVDCRFPEEVGKPGPKERPCLVLQVEEAPGVPSGKGYVVIVAYATSQKTANVYPGEFVIVKDKLNNLTDDTKFDLVNQQRLPFDSKWFGAALRTSPFHPKRGRLNMTNPRTVERLKQAIREAITERERLKNM